MIWRHLRYARQRWRWRADPGCPGPDRIVVRGSACRAASWMSRSGTPNQVWRPCRSPCGVRPVSTGSHDVRAGYAAGSCPDPSQRSAPALCSITLRSRRRGTARPQTAHRPVAASLTSRATPRPAGGWKASPGTASGHGGTGRPGRPAVVARIRRQRSWAADQRAPAGRIITGSHPQSRSSEAATRS